MTTTNYNQWVLEFNKQAQATLKTDLKIQQEAARMLYNNIVRRTPIGNPSIWNPPYWPKGYIPGSLKAAWTIEYEGDTVIISNPLPYADAVEHGWSHKQAPAGMMRISLLEWNKLLEIAVRKFK